MSLFTRLIMEVAEEYALKQSLKKTYRTYTCTFIVKFLKKVNRTQAIERVRGIKTVTVVDVKTDPSLEKINSSSDKYDYEPVDIKFITNKDPKKHLEFLVKAMVKSDEKEGIEFIPGIVAAKPKLDTLVKLK